MSNEQTTPNMMNTRKTVSKQENIIKLSKRPKGASLAEIGQLLIGRNTAFAGSCLAR